jgi:hypothetical protein
MLALDGKCIEGGRHDAAWIMMPTGWQRRRCPHALALASHAPRRRADLPGTVTGTPPPTPVPVGGSAPCGGPTPTARPPRGRAWGPGRTPLNVSCQREIGAASAAPWLGLRL